VRVAPATVEQDGIAQRVLHVGATGVGALVARLLQLIAVAAAAAVPTGFLGAVVRGVEAQRRAADGHDVGRDGRPFRGGAVIAGGGQEGYSGVARRGGEMRIEIALAPELVAAPAH